MEGNTWVYGGKVWDMRGIEKKGKVRFRVNLIESGRCVGKWKRKWKFGFREIIIVGRRERKGWKMNVGKENWKFFLRDINRALVRWDFLCDMLYLLVDFRRRGLRNVNRFLFGEFLKILFVYIFVGIKIYGIKIKLLWKGVLGRRKEIKMIVVIDCFLFFILEVI